MSEYNICQKCILPSGLFGLQLNSEGLCNYCVDPTHSTPNWKKATISKEDKERNLKEWDVIIKGLQKKYGEKEYSCLIGYSGGKDSTALLDSFIYEYNLKPFLVTVDTGFMTDIAKNNIKQTLKKLGLQKDHIFIEEAIPTFSKLYRYLFMNYDLPEKCLTLETCHICTDLIHTICVKEAMKRDLKYIFIGFSPDQVARYFFETSYEHTYQDGLPHPKGFKDILKKNDITWFLNEEIDLKDLPRVVYPYHVIDYDEKEIINRIESKGYILKGKGDPILTNCFVVKAAMMHDLYRFGGLSYALQYAELVRLKYGSEEHKKSRKDWIRLMVRVGRQILNDTFAVNEINTFFDRVGISKKILLDKIKKSLNNDPNKEIILKNIQLIQERKLK